MKLVRYSAVVTVVICAAFALAESGARTTFDAIKALEGTSEGKNSQGLPLKVTFREPAGGSALMSEILGGGHENMVSMIHMDGDRLLMTHYCGAATNRE